MREEIDGIIFINGIMCDGSGKPITVKNGYSSEDEEAAIDAYKNAKQNSYAQKRFDQMPKSSNKQKKVTKKECAWNYLLKRKFIKKMTLKDEELYEVIIDGDIIIPKYRNNTLCNEEGKEISIENGYTEEDVRIAQKAFEEYSKNL